MKLGQQAARATKLYFHFDGLGSTWALTDENENVTDNYSYSAFGVTVSATSTNGPSTNPMRFGGRWGYYDDGAMGSSSGLSLLGVRYVSIGSGRLWTWDPIANGSSYSYVDNSAPNAVDPSGNSAKLCVRPISWVLPRDPEYMHWFIITDRCGCIGYGHGGVMLNCRDNLGGWPIDTLKCTDMNASLAREKSLCDLAKNAKNGWVMCGHLWTVRNYNWAGQNCQEFIKCLYSKCFEETE
jgi:RHS repeat-associated protein